MIVAALIIAMFTGGISAAMAGLAFGASFWLCGGVYILSGSLTTIFVVCVAALCQSYTADQDSRDPALAHV